MFNLLFRLLSFAHNDKMLPEQPVHWVAEPIVAICQNSNFTKEEVESVLKFWEYRGHHTLGVIENFDCSDRKIPGFILITRPFNIKEKHLAMAGVVYKGKNIKFAVIQIRQNLSPKQRYIILAHEFGHAFGFMHLDKERHIMNPYYHNMGFLDSGLYR